MTLEEKYYNLIDLLYGQLPIGEEKEPVVKELKDFRKEVEQGMLDNWEKPKFYELNNGYAQGLKYGIIRLYNKHKKYIKRDIYKKEQEGLYTYRLDYLKEQGLKPLSP